MANRLPRGFERRQRSTILALCQVGLLTVFVQTCQGVLSLPPERYRAICVTAPLPVRCAPPYQHPRAAWQFVPEPAADKSSSRFLLVCAMLKPARHSRWLFPGCRFEEKDWQEPAAVIHSSCSHRLFKFHACRKDPRLAKNCCESM